MSMHGLPEFSASAWQVFGVPLVNHLWQSTLFAAVAGLLTLLLKTNQAQARYCVWLVASIKFLLPFSLLASLGSLLSPAVPSGAIRYVLIIEEIGQPFAPLHATQAAPATLAVLARFLPALLLAGWFCGFTAVLLFWRRRWQRLRTAIHRAAPLDSGRELEMLRRLEQAAGRPVKIRLMVSEAALEPGIVGVFRPVMLLPEGISGRLSDAQLEAVMTHELCHVRRRDNLAAALHMLVEALFWFHPLVWWIGARLVAERERACDEEVLRQGSEPQAYAEGILKVCEFYLESPLVCVAGVTGSNLKQRIEEIMVHRIARKLNLAKKLVLTTSAAAALALPVIVGLLHPVAGRAQSSRTAASSVLQDVSIRPAGAVTPGESVRMRFLQQNGTLDVKNITLQHLIHYAYGVSPARIAGAPGWMASDLYDLNLKTKEDIGGDPFKLALQELISQRFKLAAHHEWKSGPVYELTVGPNGPKLAASNEKEKMDRIMIKPVGHMEATNVKIAELVKFLQDSTGYVVVDKTGLNGTYDLTLNAEGMSMGPAKTPESVAALQKALSEQLGLELNQQNGMVDTLVIDHVEKIPAEGSGR